MTVWTTERVASFRKYFDKKWSFAKIAEKVGGFEHTKDGGRNACIGLAHRMGLIRSVSPRKTKPHVARQRAAKVRSFTKPNVQPSLAPEPLPPVEIYSTAHLCTLADLGPKSCRWPCWDSNTPAGERFYCGTPDADTFGGRPYCGHHSGIAFNPAPERKPRPYHFSERAA